MIKKGVNMKERISIVHIDNNPADCEYVKQILKKQKYFTLEKHFSISSLDQLNNLLAKERIDVVLTDLNLTGFTGIDVLKFVKKNYPETSVIVLTGTGTEELAVEALKAGADDYLTKKKINFDRLPERIKAIEKQKILTKELKEKEKYLKTLTDVLPEAIIDVKLPERVISFATRGVSHIFGYIPEEIIGEKTSILFTTEEEYKLLGEKIKKAIENKKQYVSFQTMLKKKNGEKFFANVVSTFLYKDNGEIEKTIDIIRDITEEFAREKELIFERNKFQSLFETSVDAIFLLNEKGIFIDANSAAARLLECNKSEIIGKSPLFFSPEKQRDGKLSEIKAMEKINNALKGVPQQFEWIHKTMKGKEIICNVSLNTFSLENIKYITAIVRDVTKVKTMEEDIRKQNELMSHIFALSPAIIYILNPEDFSLEWYSKNINRLLGYSDQDIKDGKEWWYKNVHKEDLKRKEIKLKPIFKDKHIVREFRFYKKDGTLIWIKDELVLIEDEKGNPREIIGVWIDVTEAKKQEKEIEEERRKFKLTINSIEDSIIVVDKKGKILILNPGAEKLLGNTYENLKGKNLSNLINLSNEKGLNCHQLLKDFLEKGSIPKLKADENLFSFPDRKDSVFSISISPLSSGNKLEGAVIILRDITERVKLLETNTRVSKLEAINTLAGGIAHDFNNLLTSLYGYIDLAQRVTIDPRVKSYLEKSIKTSKRAKALASRLLSLSKKQTPDKKIQDISDNTIDVVSFATSGSAIDIKFYMEPLPLVNVDATQIEEVIENIVINASQAMKGKGIIKVSAKKVPLKDKEVGTLPEGDYVKISISDTGPGIPDDIKNKIFEPFFTTKKNGTGLGLAACYSIIQKHNGWIDFESEKGKGTTFHIYLPVAKENIDIEITKKEKTQQQLDKGNVLIMDDEDGVRNILKEFLNVLGFNVFEAEKGEDVLELLKKAQREEIKIKAIILDLIIKNGLNGVETCKKIREFDKKIPIIAISGFSNDQAIAYPEQFGFTAALRKPISLKTLEKTLKKILPQTNNN